MIFFLSDNGPSAEGNPTQPGNSRGFGRTLDGHTIYKGNDARLLPGPANTDAEYQIGWANVSATPFRLHKWFQTEGGTASPFIAHWPKGIFKIGERREQVIFRSTIISKSKITVCYFVNIFVKIPKN